MNKLEYIPGDIVKIEYGKATGKIGFVTNTFLRRKGCYSLVVFIGKGFQGSSKDDWIQTYNDEVSPIPLNTEILEKNGWNKSIGWSYVGSEERGYQFSKELDDKWDELDRMTYGDLQICQCENLRDWSYINECNHYFRFEFTYVHELQHLLYALHIDSNLKI